MLTLGLDIGTTTISAVVAENGVVLESITKPHDSFLKGRPAWERAQDVSVLRAAALEAVAALTEKYSVACIGITGQQHGILYLDENGNLLSPLYTWQDGRGNQPLNGSTYAAKAARLTGYAVATGYGLVTHWYNLQNGLVPENAAVLTTIHDYIAMVLCGLSRPVTEPSDAQSLGFFDLQADAFDTAALAQLGIDPAILPRVVRKTFVGKTEAGIPVAVPIGDNPASFLGATGGEDAVLVNVGTGSQISVHSRRLVPVEGLELRPYPLGGYLQVGAALCGGKAWALTERFFSDTLYALTGQRMELYGALDALLEATPDDGTHPTVETTFDGTRTDPEKRGAVTGLTSENFTPGQLALGVLHGMTDELYDMYYAYLQAGLPQKQLLLGSGNGLRKNRHLCRITENTFGMNLKLTQQPEEAALGAAMYAQRIKEDEQ